MVVRHGGRRAAGSCGAGVGDLVSALADSAHCRRPPASAKHRQATAERTTTHLTPVVSSFAATRGVRRVPALHTWLVTSRLRKLRDSRQPMIGRAPGQARGGASRARHCQPHGWSLSRERIAAGDVVAWAAWGADGRQTESVCGAARREGRCSQSPPLPLQRASFLPSRLPSAFARLT